MTIQHKVLFGSAAGAVAVALLAFAFSLPRESHAATLTQLSSQLDVGSTGPDVTTLQTLLASNPLIYPQALITGYYGPLTQTAVTQFQIGYGLPAVGRVGPQTLDLINQLIANGDTTLDVSAPIVTDLKVVPSSTTATITWSTNENASGSVHYDIFPISFTEVSAAHQEPLTSGTLISETTSGMWHSITITGLTPGHLYYFSTESRDTTGNVSVTLSQSFMTTPQ